MSRTSDVLDKQPNQIQAASTRVRSYRRLSSARGFLMYTHRSPRRAVSTSSPRGNQKAGTLTQAPTPTHRPSHRPYQPPHPRSTVTVLAWDLWPLAFGLLGRGRTFLLQTGVEYSY
ncbi:TonB-dependent receptor [Marssonina coronariae]|uniref:TonB-dependent receptor n=1 Tax=Diplocarpon coronariae TaxID=2795749 RepID=A0A218Z005_9HELO|nr:TonB-dependent receptor [Marssonina coronariae]